MCILQQVNSHTKRQCIIHLLHSLTNIVIQETESLSLTFALRTMNQDSLNRYMVWSL